MPPQRLLVRQQRYWPEHQSRLLLLLPFSQLVPSAAPREVMGLCSSSCPRGERWELHQSTGTRAIPAVTVQLLMEGEPLANLIPAKPVVKNRNPCGGDTAIVISDNSRCFKKIQEKSSSSDHEVQNLPPKQHVQHKLISATACLPLALCSETVEYLGMSSGEFEQGYLAAAGASAFQGAKPQQMSPVSNR